MRKEAALIKAYIPQLLAARDLQGARDAYFSLYHIATTQKAGGDDALNYYQLYDSLRTTLSDTKNRDFVAEMESKYESQKKNLKIMVQEKAIQRKSALNWILALSILGTGLLAGIIIARLQLLRSRKEAKMQQQFTRGLLKNTEQERGRIAGELHDGISHELLGLKNNLQAGLPSTEQKIDTIINDIRRISRNLHPVMLDKIGLKYSIEHHCEQLLASGKLFVSAEIDYDKQLSAEDELQLYRIVQESLNNVVKYAGAHAAKITIVPAEEQLIVKIIDNGKGFDVPAQLEGSSAFGLHSLIERGKALGGKTTITSGEEGTIIHLEIPISNGNRNHSG